MKVFDVIDTIKCIFLDSHHIYSRSCGNHFPVCSIKRTLGKIILFLKAAENVLVKNRSRIGGNRKRDGGFTKRIYVLANRAAELRSSEQRGGGEEGELRMTQTRVARK